MASLEAAKERKRMEKRLRTSTQRYTAAEASLVFCRRQKAAAVRGMADMQKRLRTCEQQRTAVQASLTMCWKQMAKMKADHKKEVGELQKMQDESYDEAEGFQDTIAQLERKIVVLEQRLADG
jgi:chromosome segregation ATPase